MIIGIFESQSYFELGISVCNVKKVKKNVSGVFMSFGMERSK